MKPRMNAAGWYVWTVLECADDGELMHVTTVKTDTPDKAAAHEAYMGKCAHGGYKPAPQFEIKPEVTA